MLGQQHILSSERTELSRVWAASSVRGLRTFVFPVLQWSRAVLGVECVRAVFDTPVSEWNGGYIGLGWGPTHLRNHFRRRCILLG